MTQTQCVCASHCHASLVHNECTAVQVSRLMLLLLLHGRRSDQGCVCMS